MYMRWFYKPRYLQTIKWLVPLADPLLCNYILLLSWLILVKPQNTSVIWKHVAEQWENYSLLEVLFFLIGKLINPPETQKILCTFALPLISRNNPAAAKRLLSNTDRGSACSICFTTCLHLKMPVSRDKRRDWPVAGQINNGAWLCTP